MTVTFDQFIATLLNKVFISYINQLINQLNTYSYFPVLSNCDAFIKTLHQNNVVCDIMNKNMSDTTFN